MNETRITIADQAVTGELLPPEAPRRHQLPPGAFGILLLDADKQPLGFAPLKPHATHAYAGIDTEGNPVYARASTGLWRVDWTPPPLTGRALVASTRALRKRDFSECPVCGCRWAFHDEWGCTRHGPSACTMPRPPDPDALHVAAFVIGTADGVHLAGVFDRPIPIRPGHRWAFALTLDPPTEAQIAQASPVRQLPPGP